jgi:D-alanyl-D-alanine carboxypeptidase
MDRPDHDSPALDAPPHRTVRRSLAVALLLIAGLLAIPAAAPAPVGAIGPLPACRLAEIPTVPRDYGSWRTTLVDWLLTVGQDYFPPDLVPVSDAGITGDGLIRQVAVDDLAAMAFAAAEAGTPIAVDSAYRSYAEQVASFNGWVRVDGYEDAITYSQRPGHSEHQLGLAIDFMTKGGSSALEGDWATTPAGAWMAENSWKYGWILSYPKGNGGKLFSDVTCLHYEPWQYRYLGRELAAKVHASGLTIREYLWANFTMVDPITGEALPTATPTPSPTASATPRATPSATPSPTQTPMAIPTATPAGGQPSGTWLGMDPPVVLAGLLFIALASIGFVAWRAFSRSQYP